ncbi:MAG: DUF4917 family protein [Sphingorhabdus sp.]
MPVISFQEALHKTEGLKRHLLLGNGFSIALFPNRFRYGSLLQQAFDDGLFENYPELFEAFNILETTDFEIVLEALIRMTKLLHLYVGDPDPKQKMLDHVERLKEALVTAIAGSHPARLSEISEEQFESCRNFLHNFSGKDLPRVGNIYTLNYDLLLYWTILHNPEPDFSTGEKIEPEDSELLIHDDGFRNPDDDPDAPYVTWDIDGGSNSQNIHFLHGGLHLFDAAHELQKYCWERAGGVPLMDQIKQALDEERYPMFVSEGDSDSKLEKIMHSGYLSRSFKSLAGVCQTNSANSTLFLYGHSLADSDNHILSLIEEGKIRSVFISIFGNENDEWNKALVERAKLLPAKRDNYPLTVHLYDAASATVWE